MRVLRTFPSAAASLVAALSAFPAASLTAQDTGVSHSRITITGTARSFQVGDSSVAEHVANARYEMFLPRVRLQLEAAALRFAAPTDTIGGRLPVGGRVHYTLRPGDTISVFLRSSSDPLTLTPRQTSALSTAGTSTVDLESAGFGTPTPRTDSIRR